MILQSLVRYYEILAEDDECDIASPGYSMAKVSFAVNLSAQGELLGLIPLKKTVLRGKKTVEIPKPMKVPEQEKKTVGVKSNFLCENVAYIFGIDSKGKPERARKCFQEFQKRHREILQNVNCLEAKALLQFIENWNPEQATQTPVLEPYMDELLSGAFLIFKLDGGAYLHQVPAIQRAWEADKNVGTDNVQMQCLVTGRQLPIARLHPSIKGVKGAQSTGASIVSFNDLAYESYGREKDQGLNAPVSQYAAFAYTTMLNYLLADEKHRMVLGDTTILYWAESPQPIYRDVFCGFFSPSPTSIEEKQGQSKGAEFLVGSVVEKLMRGQNIADFSDVLDSKTDFYILGLAPNASRLSIRFFLHNTFGGFIENMQQHYKRLELEHAAYEREIISIKEMLEETVSENATDKSASPLLAGAVSRAILLGQDYPALLMNAVMLRIRAEHEVSYKKTATVKAYLLKNFKAYQEECKVALNEESNNKAYVLGRLFAVLEKVQQDANPGINATIRDRYFTSACATPGAVFPVLLRLSQHHIAKAAYGGVSDRRIEQLLQKLDVENDPIPVHLSLNEQGVFILGYYHQKNANYKKKEGTENE
ncbi:type I-C CRISPR-associated protein Cas8c/Csd1 [Clostridium sp. D33t1_170424_F3]|uniref:type I-C CRISPR-associated protein Cas8c/Csd1 n=1 Tax=Clostridium sp. D33t1_170424_F3 TaxID=2787099 RepID=UPI0018A9B74B|nr:type I-C CRISPR-associated protein Cas8c/Csd1 [Clostridium sp. D33t1_170424_F3]